MYEYVLNVKIEDEDARIPYIHFDKGTFKFLRVNQDGHLALKYKIDD